MPFFVVGIYHTKAVENVGTLWRAAYQVSAAGLFTLAARYKHHPSDPFKTTRHIPLRNFNTFEQLVEHRQENGILVGIEEGGTPLTEFDHLQQAIYLLGAEDYGLPGSITEKCNCVVSLDAVVRPSYNVAVAGSIVLYDRVFGKR